VIIITDVWLGCTSNPPTLTEDDAIQGSTMVYPLESGRKKEGIRAIWDTGKCLEVRAQLHTEDPGLSGFILVETDSKRSKQAEKVWVLSAKIGINTLFKFRLFEARQSCIQCN
jgi:hypothetical protein